MKLLKTESPYLDRSQWRKVFLALSIMTLVLYIVAMIFSLSGSNYFILNYQNTQMDRIEAFFEQYKIYPLITWVFTTIEFAIVMSFILVRIPKWYYILIFYAIAMIISAVFPATPMYFYQIYPFAFYLIIPIIEQLIDNRRSDYNVKFSFKKYGFQLLRLAIAMGVTFLLQVMIYVIKAGYFSVAEHKLHLSGFFIYSLEYDIALAVILFTILLLYREKGDSKLWATYQDHGGSSQTSTKQSQKSLLKNLTKTQKNKIFWVYTRFYLTQILGFLLLMVLPFLLGKVFEFLIMYFSFALIRFILGFKYSLHYKKESTCITVGVVVFGILSLAVPFFTVLVILAIVLGTSLAILLHLSYKYQGMWLFNKMAKPDKFALLYTFFDGDLTEHHVKKMCVFKGLDNEQVQLIYHYTQGEKISYIAWKFNYSQRMLIYKLDEAIDKLIA